MLKGVNRQVVDIPHPDSAYFERVLFFVKPEFSDVSELKLRSSADALIKNATPPPDNRRNKLKSRRLRQVLGFSLAAAAGAVTSALGLMLFMQ